MSTQTETIHAEVATGVETPAVATLRQVAMTLLRGSAVYGIANFGTRAISFFFLLPLYTRYLSPADYGIISLAETVAAFVMSVAVLSLDDAMRRFYFHYRDDSLQLERYLSTIFTSSIFLIAAVLAIALTTGPQLLTVLLPRFSVPFYPYIALAIAAACATQIWQFRLVLFQLQGREASYAMLSVIAFALTATACIALVAFLHMGAYGMLMGKLIAASATVLLTVPFLYRSVRFGWAGKYVAESLRFSLPMVPYSLAALGMDIADRFILQYFRSNSEVGVYTVAYTVGMVMFLATISLWQAWAPLYYGSAKTDSRDVLGRLTSGLIVLLVGMATIGVLIGPVFTSYVLDSRYLVASRVIPWVVVAYFCHALFAFFQLAALQEKRTVLILGITLTAFASNITLNIVLIPRLGMFGAAYANLAAFALEALLMYIYAQRVYRLPYDMRRIVAAILVLLASLVVSQQNWQTSHQLATSIAAFTTSTCLLLLIGGRDALKVFDMVKRSGR
jgi:O-antigen/teichoic acid export membrane protein